jgi:hypothetical protein
MLSDYGFSSYTMYISRHKDKILHDAKNTYADLLELEIYLYTAYNYLTNDEKKKINVIRHELCSKFDRSMKAYYMI